MTEPNKAGRKPVPDHLKKRQRAIYVTDTEFQSVEQHIASLRGEAVHNRSNDRRLGKRETK